MLLVILGLISALQFWNKKTSGIEFIATRRFLKFNLKKIQLFSQLKLLRLTGSADGFEPSSSGTNLFF